MKTFLALAKRLATLAALTLLTLGALPANSWATHEAEQASSIWDQPAVTTSQPFRPNPNAGYAGSDLSQASTIPMLLGIVTVTASAVTPHRLMVGCIQGSE